MSRTTRYFLINLVMCAIVAILAGADSSLPATQPAQPHGLRSQDVRLTAVMEKKQIVIGDPVLLDMLVENFGDEDRTPLITVPANDFRIMLCDLNGQPVPWSKDGAELQVQNKPGSYGGSSGPIPAKAITRYGLRLDLLADMSVAGDYTVSIGLNIGRGINPMSPDTRYTKPHLVYPDHTELESNKVQFSMIKGVPNLAIRIKAITIQVGGRVFGSEPLSDDSGQPSTMPDAGK